MIWWQAIVFSLHLLSGLDPSVRDFELRLFSDSQLILDARVQRNTQTNSFRILAEGFASPAILERSRLFGQVYTVFSPWNFSPTTQEGVGKEQADETDQTETSIASDLSTSNGQPATTDGPSTSNGQQATSTQPGAPSNSTEMASSPDPQFASGPYPPSIVDLTSLLVQTSVTGSGRYSFSWPYVLLDAEEQAAEQMTSSESIPKESEASVLIDRRGLTLSIPEHKLVLNLFFGQ